MSARDQNKPFWNRDGKGYGIFLSEYNGKYALQAGKRSEQNDYPDWVYQSKWDRGTGKFGPDTNSKPRPMSVFFGDKSAAIDALQFFLDELNFKGGDKPDLPEADEADIAF